MAFGNLNVDTITGSGASSVIVNNGTNNVAGFTTGNNLQMLQNGGGIVFSNSSATVNSTLNDYETGSWTPTVAPGSGSLTSYTSSGTYTKIGNLVTIVAYFIINNAGTAGGGGSISNVPFASTNVAGQYQPTAVMRESGSTGNIYSLFLNNNSTLINFQSLTAGSIVWSNSYAYSFTLTYKTTF